jgi:hypothetical protein
MRSSYNPKSLVPIPDETMAKAHASLERERRKREERKELQKLLREHGYA